jgi:tetratricopeptide (TPR) repeat protein
VDRSFRSALVVCLVALGIHLIPLFLPRNMPAQDLEIARAIPDSAQRAQVLKALKNNPKATGADLREAAELLREGAPLDAHELAKEAERREPGVLETQLLLARLCHEARMNRCEEESFAKAGELAPGDPRADLLRADIREKEGDVGGALESVKRAYEKTPDSAGVGIRYGRLLSAAGRGDEAVEVLKGLEPKLGRPRMLVEEGLVREAQGRTKEARELFATAVDADPKLVMGYYHLGMAAFREGDVEGAAEALREADRLDMSDMRPLSALCAIQRQTGRTDDLMVTRQDLERRFPERMDAVRSACHSE